MDQPEPLSVRFPGGCYLGFNAGIDRKAAEQLVAVCSDAMRNGYFEIHICMSSTGGILDHTYYACTMLASMPIKFVTYNVGNVMSSTNLLFLCGTERYSTEDSRFFFHQTEYDPPPARSSEKFYSDRLESIKYDDTRSAKFVSSRVGKPVDVVREWQNKNTYFSAIEAKAAGIINDIRAPVIPKNAYFHQVAV